MNFYKISLSLLLVLMFSVNLFSADINTKLDDSDRKIVSENKKIAMSSNKDSDKVKTKKSKKKQLKRKILLRKTSNNEKNIFRSTRIRERYLCLKNFTEA